MSEPAISTGEDRWLWILIGAAVVFWVWRRRRNAMQSTATVLPLRPSAPAGAGAPLQPLSPEGFTTDPLPAKPTISTLAHTFVNLGFGRVTSPLMPSPLVHPPTSPVRLPIVHPPSRPPLQKMLPTMPRSNAKWPEPKL